MTKEKWVAIMKEAGFSEADMHRWHRTFERSSPEEHEQFLKYLVIAGEANLAAKVQLRGPKRHGGLDGFGGKCSANGDRAIVEGHPVSL